MKNAVKEFLFGPTIQQQSKYFKIYTLLPFIIAIITILSAFILGIIDPIVFIYNGQYGLMRLPNGFLCWLVDMLIGVAIGCINYLIFKVRLSQKIISTLYLKELNNNLLLTKANITTKQAYALRERFLKFYYTTINLQYSLRYNIKLKNENSCIDEIRMWLDEFRDNILANDLNLYNRAIKLTYESNNRLLISFIEDLITFVEGLKDKI